MGGAALGAAGAFHAQQPLASCAGGGGWSFNDGDVPAAKKPAGSGPKIVVSGSTNVDLFAYTPVMPKPGETVKGTNFMQCFGGKGSNQAIIAARLGAQVSFIGKVGDDEHGAQSKKNYEDSGIDTTYLYTATGVPTGVAPIIVDSAGENVIIIVAGANNELTVDEVSAAKATIAEASVLICQNEIPIEATQRSLELARAAGVTTIFNVAPCPTDGYLPAALYAATDVLCVNETELQVLAGVKAAEDDLDGYLAAAEELFSRGVGSVLVTLGGKGALVCTSGKAEHIKPVKLRPEQVVDTTGAGDAFTGAFAFWLSCGLSAGEAAAKAGEVAAITVQSEGTQPSYPSFAELPQAMKATIKSLMGSASL